MQIPILIEPVAGSGFCARSGEPLPLTAKGATRDEALANLRKMLQMKLQNGSEVLSIQVGSTAHPLTPFAGIWSENDPTIGEWQQAVEDYRRKLDEKDAAR